MSICKTLCTMRRQTTNINLTKINKYLGCFGTIIVLGLLFSSCKKYPENRLWFKNPQRAFTGGKLTSFKVNGDDSIPLFNSTWGYDLTQKSFSLFKPYHDYDEWTVRGDFDGSFHFAGDKEMQVILTPLQNSLAPPSIYNPFLRLADSEGKTDNRWDIIKLTRKGQLKLKRKINGTTYEVQFN